MIAEARPGTGVALIWQFRMRGLASFAMHGRFRALLLALVTASNLLFAWIAAAVVALVTLRKGGQEGLWLLLWASLPGLVLAQLTGDSSALALILGTALLAQVLRATVNMALTALLSAAVAALTGVMLLGFGEPMLDEMSRMFARFSATLQEQARSDNGGALALQAPSRMQLAGMMGAVNGVLSFLCLALARYWQAALYNPGGFGEEIRALRLPPALVWVLGIGALAIAALDLQWRSWGAALLLPLTIAGFALLHARARYRGQGSFWLGGIYGAWLVFDAAKLALVGLVLADALLDFRRRWVGAGQAPGTPRGGASGEARRPEGSAEKRPFDSTRGPLDSDSEDGSKDGSKGRSDDRRDGQ